MKNTESRYFQYKQLNFDQKKLYTKSHEQGNLPHKIHYTHHTHPSFIFKLKYPQVSGPCLKNNNKNLIDMGKEYAGLLP
jgi:hypothetical protein